MAEKVVVAGGGIAGLEIALRTERKGFQVELIDPGEELFFYPSSHKILEGEEPDTIKYSEKFEDRNIKHVKASLEDVKDGKAITTRGEKEYDYLAICTGAEPNFHGLNPVTTMRDREGLEEYARKDGKPVVVGGGATGVEAAASLSKNSEVTLIEAEEGILPRMTEEASEKARKILKKNGVEVRTGERVLEVDENSLKTDNSSFTGKILWAGGIKKSETISGLDLPQDGRGLEVDGYNRVDDRIFAAGDCCSYQGKEARAIHAIVEGKTVAKNIARMSSGRGLKERNVRFNPQIVYLGGKSLLEFRGHVFTGRIPGLLAKYGVEKRYLLTRRFL